MQVLEIPVNTDLPHSKAEFELFGQSFIFQFEFLEKENYRVLHIYDSEEKPLALGIRLITKWALFRHKNIELIMLNDSLLAYEII